MKIIFISHPISGDVTNNLERIRLIVREINLNEPDIVPFAPYWLDCHALDDSDPEQRERGMRNNTALLRSGIVTEMWLFGDRISTGMEAEVQLALDLGIPVYSKSAGTSYKQR